MKVIESSLDLIGNSPLIHLNKIEKKYGLKSHIFAKFERTNLTGSIKDRIAKEMILSLLKKKIINSKTTIISPTSGNTGISLSAICAYLKLPLIIVMPDNMSIERRKMISFFDATLELVPAKLEMKGCLDKCKELNKRIKNSYILSQFEETSNIDAHYKTTGKEIYNQMHGNIDYFIASFGSGGTICGISKYLKQKNRNIKVIAIEPSGVALFNKRKQEKNRIQGIGEDFIPTIFKKELIDEIVTCDNKNSFKHMKDLAIEEGLFVGISSGCNLAVAIDYAKKYKDKNIVTVFSDNGERYFSEEDLFKIKNPHK